MSVKYKLKIKVGNIIKVIAGNDKNKTGEVLKVLRKSKKILVKGINFKFKHNKPSSKAQVGVIKQIEVPIHYSNVKLEINKNNKKYD